MIYVKIAIFAGLMLISAIAMRPMQAALTSAMEQIRSEFIKNIEDFTGMEIHYASLRPSFFGHFDIRELRFLVNGEDFFSVSNVRMRFSIWELLLGRNTFLHTVQINRPVFNIDLERDRYIIEHIFSLFTYPPTIEEILKQTFIFLPQNVDYVISNLSFTLIDNGRMYNINNFNVNVSGKDGDIILSGRFNAEIVYENFLNRNIIFNTDIGINIIASNGEQSPSAQAELSLNTFVCSAQNTPNVNPSLFRSSVSGGNAREVIFSLNPAVISLGFNDGLLTINDNGDNFDYLFVYDTNTSEISAGLSLNEFLLSDVIVFSEQWNDVSEITRMKLTGDLHLNYKNELLDYGIYLSGLDLRFPQNNSLNINIYGDRDLVTIDEFSFFSPAAEVSSSAGRLQGSLSVLGRLDLNSFLPSGRISFEHFTFTGRESLNTILNISNNNERILVASDEIRFAQAQINDISLYIFPQERDITVLFSSYLADEGSIDFEVLYNSPRELTASARLNSVSLHEIYSVISPFMGMGNFNLPFFNNLKNSYIDTEIFLSTDFNNVILNAPAVNFDINGSPGFLSLSGTNRQILLNNGTFLFDQNELLINADLNYLNPNELNLELNASFMGLSWNLEGHIFDRNTFIVHDPNGLNIYANISNTNVISAFFEAHDFPLIMNIPNQGLGIAYLNLFINARYASNDLWNVDINNFSIRDRNASGTDIFRISGTANQFGASFGELIYRDFAGILEGSADFVWNDNFSFIEINANLSERQTQAQAQFDEGYIFVEGSIIDGNIDIQTLINNMRVNRFFGGSETILLTADAGVSWNSINSFNADINISSLRTRFQDNPLDVSVNISLNNDEILFNDFDLVISDLRTVFPEFRFNRAEGITSLRANLSGMLMERSLEGIITLNANFNQTDSWQDIRSALDVLDGVLKFENILYSGAAAEPFMFNFSANHGTTSVSGGIRDMFRLNMDNEGNFFAGLSAPLPIRGSLAGTFRNGIINASFNNFFFDLAGLWSLISRNNDFNISGGFITGNIDIRGPILNPEFFGNARGSSIRFQVPNFIPEDIRLVPFNAVLEGYEIAFGPVSTSVGAGNGTTHGWFVFENWVPVNIGLDIVIPRNTPVPYDFNIAGFLANGNASGNINLLIESLFSPDSSMEISGDFLTTNAVLGVNMEDARQNMERDDSLEDIGIYITTNFRITAGSDVEFLWPNLLNPILRASPEMGTVILASSDNMAGQYMLHSDVRIRSGELNYLDRSFIIRQGNITFRENETRFDPHFSARAEIRDRAEAGPVTISMIVENQPLLSFVPRFESNPGITQLELYSILGHNMMNVQGDDQADMRFLIGSTAEILTQVIATSDAFTQLVFMRQFERQVRNWLGLDMFTVRSRFFQNAVVTGATGGFGTSFDDEMNRGHRVGNFFDNTTVFIGRYIGQDIFVHGMFRMRYDENNIYFGGLRFEPDIGIELQSPFGVNIRWSFFPYHPENWWVSDNSITLSWSRSF
ncbi:MAG: translocation/assembly module TamB [Treponema sp.]|nr:translocation/assembly module TamB [Treponema sp.]